MCVALFYIYNISVVPSIVYVPATLLPFVIGDTVVGLYFFSKSHVVDRDGVAVLVFHYSRILAHLHPATLPISMSFHYGQINWTKCSFDTVIAPPIENVFLVIWKIKFYFPNYYSHCFFFNSFSSLVCVRRVRNKQRPTRKNETQL